MKNRARSVSITRLPDQREGLPEQTVYSHLESCINVDRPAVVIDCSNIEFLDRPALHLLLCCLEEAMKRNGDVRLAALRPEVRVVLHSTGIDYLFQCFETVDEAVESYGRMQVNAGWPERLLADEQSKPNAA
jgi:anti-sigma B factor antagonist